LILTICQNTATPQTKLQLFLAAQMVIEESWSAVWQKRGKLKCRLLAEDMKCIIFTARDDIKFIFDFKN